MRRDHVHDKPAALRGLQLEAAACDIVELVQLTDEQLTALPNGMIAEARWQFQDSGRATIDDVAALTHLVAAVCTVRADL